MEQLNRGGFQQFYNFCYLPYTSDSDPNLKPFVRSRVASATSATSKQVMQTKRAGAVTRRKASSRAMMPAVSPEWLFSHRSMSKRHEG